MGMVAKLIRYMLCAVAAVAVLHAGYSMTGFIPSNGYEGTVFIASYALAPILGGVIAFKITRSVWGTIFLALSLLVILNIEDSMSVLPFLAMSFLISKVMAVTVYSGKWSRADWDEEFEHYSPRINPSTGAPMINDVYDATGYRLCSSHENEYP